MPTFTPAAQVMTMHVWSQQAPADTLPGMRLHLLLAALGLFLVVIVAPSARADEYNPNGTQIQGRGIQTASGLNAGGKLVIQCPNTPILASPVWLTDDGGVGGADAGYYVDSGYALADAGGQFVYYRPGGCASCPVDAGAGDYLMDFSSNLDGYRVQLRGGMTKIHLRALDPSDKVNCTVLPQSP